MDILILSGELDSGGAPRVCHQIVRHLPDEVNVTVAYLGGDDGLVKDFERDGINVKRISDSPLSISAVRGLNHHLTNNSYDIIHTHMLSGGMIGRPLARIHNIPNVHTIHTNYEMRPFRAKVPDLLSAPFGDLAICVSDSVEQSLPKYYPSKTDVVYNCIDVETIRSRGKTSWEDLEWTSDLDPSEPLVANIARYDQKKRRIDIIEGFKHVLEREPNAQLVLTGKKNSHQRKLAEYAQDIGVKENIYFVGYVDNPQSVYHHTDVIVLSSESEGFSIGMLEAMAHECPIVSTDIPAFVDALGKEYPAYIPVRDPKKLGVCVIDLLTDSDKINKSVETISKRINGFSGSKAAEEYFDVYKSTIERSV